MARELRFRALTREGFMIDNVGSIEFMDGGWYIVNGEVPIERGKLMQYTGLNDKNGDPIFEGDIVDDGIPNYVGVVEWVFASWQYVFHCVNSKKRGISEGLNQHLDDDGKGGKHFKVIGNIHQNPELLERQR